MMIRKEKLKLWFNGGVIFSTLTLVIIYLHYGGPNSMLDLAWIDSHIRYRGAVGVLTFLALCAFSTAIGVPRQILSFLAGYAFGAEFGTLWAVIGSVIGCAIDFFYARFLARESIKRRFHKRLEKVDAFLSSSPFLMTFTIRCMPVGMNILTNLAGGVSSIPAKPFLAGSALGYVPQTLIFAILGSGVRVEPVWRTFLSLTLFVLSSILGMALYRRHRRRLNLANLEEGLDD